jgi:C4-type Zn-finger protein
MDDKISFEERKECPLCNEFMKLELREVVDRIPGSPQEVKRQTYEWVCPECDYFEEDEDAEGPSERPR